MLENILQLTAVVVVFVLVLAGTYYLTKWIAIWDDTEPVT